MNIKTIHTVVLSSALVLAAGSAQAASVSGLTTFTANTTAKASEVNGNFTAVQTAVNDNDSRITTLESNPGITGNLTLPESTDANTGNILKGTIPFLSDYGTNNTFVGENAGNFTLTTTSATDNTALGYQALMPDTSGFDNTASGSQALYSNTTGAYNTASGASALYYNVNGNDNTAYGYGALDYATGSNNIGLGWQAGSSLYGGSYNIYIGNQGSNLDANTIRIGSAYSPTAYTGQNATYIAGIYGVTTASATGNTVVIDSNGQLGTVLSSRRFKDHIHAMGGASEILNRLKPVTFYYKSDHDPKGRHLQYGLVAEDVAKVAPTLVSYGKNGKPDGVYYRFLAPMLLNQYQKQEQVIAAQAREIAQLKQRTARTAAKVKEIDVLKRQMTRLTTVLAMRDRSQRVAVLNRP